MVKDPQLEVARTLIHGVKTERCTSMKECIAPESLSALEQVVHSENEKIYDSNKRKPLGMSPKLNFPNHINPDTTVFGKILMKGEESVSKLLNPNVRKIELLNRELEDRTHYMRPYSRLLPGEQAKRDYNDHFSKDTRFGLVSCCDKEGGYVHQLMHWVDDRTNRSVDAECSNRSKTLPDTVHAFGKPSMINKRNVAELMFGYAPRNILGLTDPHSAPFHDNRGIGNQCIDLNEQARIVGALVKKQLRDKRYNRGPDLAATLCYLANGEQYITETAAQMIYEAFEPPLDEELRELLFDVIRNDNTRSSESVGFREADTNDSKIINWRLMAKMLDHNRLQFWERSFKHDGIEDTHCVPHSMECAETTRLRIADAIRARSKILSTTNAIHEGQYNGLIRGSPWCRLGVLAQSCEIEKILEETGLSGGCNVEKIWSIAKQFDREKMVMGTATYDDERVTLEGVRQALNQYNCQQIEAKVAEKYKSCCITMPEENNEELLI